jgi:hypothetical protein
MSYIRAFKRLHWKAQKIQNFYRERASVQDHRGKYPKKRSRMPYITFDFFWAGINLVPAQEEIKGIQ